MNKRNVQTIREELLVEENLYKIERENNKKLKEELSKKQNRFIKLALIVAAFSNVVIFPILFLLIPDMNIFELVAFSLSLSTAVFPILMFIYIAFFSNPEPVIDVEGWHKGLNHLRKVRKLEFELLESTMGSRVIRTINNEHGKYWHNLIIEVDGKAKEYYVSFPRDEKGYASVEYYEFIPGKISDKSHN